MNIQQLPRAESDFQQPLEEQALLRVLGQALPHSPIVGITEFDAGWFNNSFHIKTSTTDYVLKVAPSESAEVFFNERHLMQREEAMGPALESVSPLVPRYLSFFEIQNRRAFLQPFIDGRLWSDAMSSLTERENNQLWYQLGQFCRTAHAQTGSEFGYPKPCERFQCWSDFIFDTVSGLMEDCRRYRVEHPEVLEYWRLLSRFAHHLDGIKTPSLLHGDLWPRNVIFDGEGGDIHIKAVIDGERAYWGDPLSEWVLILLELPQAFWQGYGENLLLTRHPLHIAIYRGMYFIVNILEATRFQSSDNKPRGQLAEINQTLTKLA